ncbi:hypothetical protein Scep_030750 [Stephania cephalantha]|uniref:HSF-type DNA-binding domain-containing protein n=1 Tax=Stephania cephalantha TaxID=152367 RepID=A0AAP0E7W2_9MAGN
MVEDPSTDAIVSWNEARNSFHRRDSYRLASNLLPKYFKHNNFSNFVRHSTPTMAGGEQEIDRMQTIIMLQTIVMLQIFARNMDVDTVVPLGRESLPLLGEVKRKVLSIIDKFADRGLRSLGVASLLVR